MKRVFWTTLCLSFFLSYTGWSTHSQKPAHQPWSFEGPTGTFDRAALRRGLQVYREVCASCHSAGHLRYEKLKALGFTEADVKSIAADYEVPGPVGVDGETTKRKAEPKDFFAHPYATDAAARAANNGSLPADLSLVVKARKGGPDYVFAFLTGYEQAPANIKLATGMHYNLYFTGHQTAMAPPLTANQVTYPDGTAATVDQMARDVVTFLAWASEPETEHRKQMGVMVLIFLTIFTGMLFILTRRIWWDVKKH